ncbi:MAG: alpha-L-fucosidase [Actinobacteria bacterium]|nr:alpha-L-fucosidase [Actinomycetota bacterium]
MLTAGSGPDLAAVRRFNRWRIGLFVHWGSYALLGRGEQVLFREQLVPSTYVRPANRFRPNRFDANQWARDAKAAGMRYAVLTTKHHDGYCLFDSRRTDYCAPRTGPGRDLVREFVRAFRAEGLGVGFYYSLADWRFPAYFEGARGDTPALRRFVDYIHAQVDELCSHYGRLDILWFDGAWPLSAERWRSDDLMAFIRRKQPHALINNRALRAGDFDTPEQRIVASAPGRPWEACLTSQHRWWGYHAGESAWRTPRDVILALARTAGGGGNLLLNVGPRADGTWPARFHGILRRLGAWLAVNGEAIYGTEAGVCDTWSIGQMTVKGNRAYLLAFLWPGAELHVGGLASRVTSARLLATGQELAVVQQGEHLVLRGLPRRPPDLDCSVIALQLDGPAKGAPWAAVRLWQPGADPGAYASWAAS